MLLAGVAAGVLLCTWRDRRRAAARKQIPTHWPLNPRLLANSDERAVWRWLCASFPDHHVMVKIPLTRFTLPQEQAQSRRWFELLGGVYCTLSVCSREGRVVGCLDVQGAVRLSRRNRLLKQSLLGQCGIAYWVVEPGDLPTREEVRAEFLGEMPAAAAGLDGEIHIDAARLRLRAELARQRESREGGHPPRMPPGTRDWRVSESDPSSLNSGHHPDTGWPQPDSFVAPLDSRRDDLR